MSSTSCPHGHSDALVLHDGVLLVNGREQDRFRCETANGSFHRFFGEVHAATAHPVPVGVGDPWRGAPGWADTGVRPAAVQDAADRPGLHPSFPVPLLSATPSGRRRDATRSLLDDECTALMQQVIARPAQALDTAAVPSVPHASFERDAAASDPYAAESPTEKAARGAVPASSVPPRDGAPASVQRGPGRVLVLPSPPTDEEKFWYLGAQNRWFLWVGSGAGLLVLLSLVRFALSNPITWAFLGLVMLRLITSAVGLISSSRRRRGDGLDHETRVLTWQPVAYPSVDVFLPSAGEHLDVLANTYRYISRLQWAGRLVVHILDDSARPEVADLAAGYGFMYHTRPNRGFMKKAGNLKYGFEHSDGDLIAVFDADFVPRPEYLSELVPYFDDPTVGIVQSPQFFDTGHRMNWLQRGAGATQELFYRFVQPARDAADAAICVGTCAVYRRTALERAGGFAQIGHSEDVHTGVKLLKVGFVVRYVPVLVAKGLCPDTLSGFLNQQYRWCTGSMSLLVDRSFHGAPLKFKQRMCFWSGFLYYISTGVFVFTVALPSLVLRRGGP